MTRDELDANVLGVLQTCPGRTGDLETLWMGYFGGSGEPAQACYAVEKPTLQKSLRRLQRRGQIRNGYHGWEPVDE